MAKKRGAATPALKVLDAAGLWHTTHTYTSAGSDFGAEAAAVMAERLGTSASRIFKTLLVDVRTGRSHAPAHGTASHLAVAMAPVDQQLDLKAVAAALGAPKAAMADPQLAQRTSGYVLGGVSPLGQKVQLPTVIDAAAQRAIEAGETIFFSGGKRGLEIEMHPAEFIALLGATCAPIATQ